MSSRRAITAGPGPDGPRRFFFSNRTNSHAQKGLARVHILRDRDCLSQELTIVRFVNTSPLVQGWKARRISQVVTWNRRQRNRTKSIPGGKGDECRVRASPNTAQGLPISPLHRPVPRTRRVVWLIAFNLLVLSVCLLVCETGFRLVQSPKFWVHTNRLLVGSGQTEAGKKPANAGCRRQTFSNTGTASPMMSSPAMLLMHSSYASLGENQAILGSLRPGNMANGPHLG